MPTIEQCNKRHARLHVLLATALLVLIGWNAYGAITGQDAQTGVEVLNATVADIQRRCERIENGVDELKAARLRD